MIPFKGFTVGTSDFDAGIEFSSWDWKSAGFSGLILRIRLKLEASLVKVVSTVPKELVAEKPRK